MGEITTHGLSTAVVHKRVQTGSAALNAYGCTVTNTDTLITPQPIVRQLSQEQTLFVAASLPGRSTGISTSPMYAVGPIALPFSGGGYDPTDLIGADTDTVRTVLLIDGVAYKILKYQPDAFGVVYFASKAQDIS